MKSAQKGGSKPPGPPLPPPSAGLHFMNRLFAPLYLCRMPPKKRGSKKRKQDYVPDEQVQLATAMDGCAEQQERGKKNLIAQ